MTVEIAFSATCDRCDASSSYEPRGNGQSASELNHDLRELGWHRKASKHLCDDCWDDGIRFKDLEP